MDYETFKEYVTKSGYKVKAFAKLIGMNHRSISNYSSRGKVPEHLALIALMMFELDRKGVRLEDVVSRMERV